MSGQLAIVRIILLVTGLLALGVALFSWRRRRAGNWTYPFIATALAAAWWAFSYGFELGAPTYAQKIFWVKVEYLGIVIIPPLWFLFAVCYTNTNRSLCLKWTRALPLFIIPGLTFLLAATNERHNLIWQSVQLDTSGAFPVLDHTYGAWFWFYSAYSYLLLAGATLALLVFVRRSPKSYRWQNVALILGALFPWMANAVYLFRWGPFPNVDFSPVAFVLSATAILWSIFRFQLFDVVPIARRVTVDTMQDGVIVLDNQNRIVDINNAALKMVNAQSEAVIGKPIGVLLVDWPDLLATYRDVLSVETEIRLETEEGDRYFELNISPLSNFRQRVNGRLILFHDITSYKATQQELMQARDQALEASRVKMELLSRVSHELRTPLNVIMGYTEMVQEGVLGKVNEAQFEAMEKVLESTHFLTRQVNDLLDFSNIQSGRTHLNYTFFAIADVLTEVSEKTKDAAQEKSLKLTSEIIDDFPAQVYSDRERIVQVLTNLVDNAIKFSNEGTIRICIFQENTHYWAIEVSDEGPGIPGYAHDLIFQPFRQIDGSMTRIHGGTGLGLAIVKQVVELMGGVINLKSDGGRGSTFIVLLPNKTPVS